MGNGYSDINRRRTKPRVVLEYPEFASTERMAFVKTPSDVEHFLVQPRMLEIGTVHPDNYEGDRLKFYSKSINKRSFDISENSRFSASANGNWKPTLNSNDKQYLQDINIIQDERTYPAKYINCNNYHNVDNALARVNDI